MPPKKEKTSAYKEYVCLTIDCIKKYGPKTIVLYRSGIFYEVYSKVGDAVLFDEFTKALSFKYSTNASGVRLAGVQWHTLYDEHLDTLINAGFTVVVSEAKPKRCITDVITPGTHLPSKDSSSNRLCVVCFTEGSTRSSSIIIVGIATIDSTTGKSSVDEYICSNLSELQNTLPEYLNIINPKEIVFVSSKFKKLTLTQKDLERTIPYNTVTTSDKLSTLPVEFENETYQKALLQKVFPPKNALSVFENCGIEDLVSGRKAYTYLLDYVHSKNENALKGIDYPTRNYAHDSNYMRFSPCAAKHLSFDELERILNKCKTPMGKRAFSDRIRSPHTSISKINQSYDVVSSVSKCASDVRAHLERAFDLERIFRLMERNRLHPCDVWKLLSTLESSATIHSLIGDILRCPFDDEEVKKCVEYIHSQINVHIIHGVKLHTISDTLFQGGVHSHIDSLQDTKDQTFAILEQIRDGISSSCKIERGAKEYSLRITKDKWEKAKPELKGKVDCGFGRILNLKEITSKPNRSDKSLDLSHRFLDELFVSLLRYDDQIASEVSKAYSSFVSSFVENYRELIKTIITYITEADWYSNIAFIADTYRYKRPICVDSDVSYIKFSNARHPIVEVIEDQVSYVPHSLDLVPDQSCVLLYGVNASGKSTTVKTIGLLAVMAQTGMFVPVENMEFSPYHSLFVRVPTGDNLMKGKSTFEVEGGELREIIKGCNSRSLVIGDELCSGTESESATAIVASGLCRLQEAKATVIFATHYHTLTQLKRIQTLIQNKNVRVFHHSVIWDETTKVLIYDRLLKEGQGSSLYGLEVCKSLGFDEDFLLCANEFRKELGGVKGLVTPNFSHYNSKLLLNLCSVCGINPAEETHHIKRQETADEKGYIGHEHKNRLSNLGGICIPCHDKETYEGESIVGYVKTSEGIKLQTTTPKPLQKKELQADLVEKVKYLNSKSYSVKRISIECGITPYMVKKIVSQTLSQTSSNSSRDSDSSA